GVRRRRVREIQRIVGGVALAVPQPEARGGILDPPPLLRRPGGRVGRGRNPQAVQVVLSGHLGKARRCAGPDLVPVDPSVEVVVVVVHPQQRRVARVLVVVLVVVVIVLRLVLRLLQVVV